MSRTRNDRTGRAGGLHAGGRLRDCLLGPWRAIFRLAQSWWRADRVRVAAREGRILRLRPPAVILLAERQVEVHARSVIHGELGTLVVYDCQTSTGPAQIRATIFGADVWPSVQWIENQRALDIAAADLEIWSG